MEKAKNILMNSFTLGLEEKIRNSLTNQFGIENFDEYRFGKYNVPKIKTYQKFKNILKGAIGYKPDHSPYIKSDFMDLYKDGLEYLYQQLGEHDKRLLIDIIAYRILGFQKVKLPRNNEEYLKALETVKELKDTSDTIDPHFLHIVLEKFNLKPIGYDIELYFSDVGIAIDFIIEQYAYRKGRDRIVFAEKDDIVLDIGGCWGDTALYFASKVGEDGKVYSFEFIPENIKIFQRNMSLNPCLKKRINLVQNPVSNIFGHKVYYLDNGPGSFISNKPLEGSNSGESETISIDDFVMRNNISKIDFIKMDIEGAEIFALEGAINTIRRFKPKLAIAIYHSMNDFVDIPKWIMDLNLGYNYYLGHYTIHAEETVFFAKPREND
jgi:FkbM family methyltransferase